MKKSCSDMNRCFISELVILVELVPSCHQPHSHSSVTSEFLSHVGEVADEEFHVIEGQMKCSSIPFCVLCADLERFEDFSDVIKLLPIISCENIITKLLPVLFHPGCKFFSLL